MRLADGLLPIVSIDSDSTSSLVYPPMTQIVSPSVQLYCIHASPMLSKTIDLFDSRTLLYYLLTLKDPLEEPPFLIQLFSPITPLII